MSLCHPREGMGIRWKAWEHTIRPLATRVTGYVPCCEWSSSFQAGLCSSGTKSTDVNHCQSETNFHVNKLWTALWGPGSSDRCSTPALEYQELSSALLFPIHCPLYFSAFCFSLFPQCSAMLAHSPSFFSQSSSTSSTTWSSWNVTKYMLAKCSHMQKFHHFGDFLTFCWGVNNKKMELKALSNEITLLEITVLGI